MAYKYERERKPKTNNLRIKMEKKYYELRKKSGILKSQIKFDYSTWRADSVHEHLRMKQFTPVQELSKHCNQIKFFCSS